MSLYIETWTTKSCLIILLHKSIPVTIQQYGQVYMIVGVCKHDGVVEKVKRWSMMKGNLLIYYMNDYLVPICEKNGTLLQWQESLYRKLDFCYL